MPRRRDNPYAPHDWAPHENQLCSVRRRHRCTVRRNASPTAWSVCWCVSPARWATQWSPPTCSCCRVPSPLVDRNRPLPAVYVMTNVSINLLLVKFRQQFGLRAFTEGFLVLYVLVTFSTSSSTISAQR